MSANAYHIVAIDLQGQVSNRRVEAATAEQASQQATDDGFSVLQCEPAGAVRGTFNSFTQIHRGSSAKLIDTVVFSQDMATLMAAGLTVKEAIHALATQEAATSRRHVFNQLDSSVMQGLSFSTAMQKTQAFPDLLVATVAASEQTGDLAIGLSRYAQHQQSLRAVRDRVIGACVYPLLLLVVGSIVVTVLMGVVVPRFATLIDSTGRELPVLSKLLMSWGHFAGSHPIIPILLFLCMASIIVGLAASWKNAEFRKKWLSKIPGIAKVVREFQHLQMYRTLAILTARGITIHKALPYTMELLSPGDRARLTDALAQMREGVSISHALSTTGLSDVVATSMLNVAERTGALPEMLDRIADFYERTLQRNIDIVSRLIEPVLMIILGIVVGGIVILMYLPIFDLASSVS